MIKHECPKCGQSIESSDRLAGDQVICPECDASVKVPLLPAEAPGPPPLPPGEDTLPSKGEPASRVSTGNEKRHITDVLAVNPEERAETGVTTGCSDDQGHGATGTDPGKLKLKPVTQSVVRAESSVGGSPGGAQQEARGNTPVSAVLAVLAVVVGLVVVILIVLGWAGKGTSWRWDSKPAPGRHGLGDGQPLPPPPLQPGWQRVAVSGVGTINIPPSMEVRGREMAKAVKKLGLAPNRLVIQQRGMNDLDRDAMGLYVRIIFQPEDRADPDELADLLKSGDDGALRDESNASRTNAEAMAQVMGGRILQWDFPTIERIGGVRAYCQRYRRQSKNGPPVVLVSYRFLVGVKPWSLTIAYYETDKDRWAGFIPAIVDSFRIMAGDTPSNKAHVDRSDDILDELERLLDTPSNKPYVDQQHGFSIVFPVGWTTKPPLDPNQNIVIKAIHRDRQRQFATLIVYVWNLRDVVLDPSKATPAEFFEASYKDTAVLLNSGRETIAGEHAIWLHIKFKTPLIDQAIIYVMSHRGKVYALMGQTAMGGNEWFTKNKPLLLAAIRTLKFTQASVEQSERTVSTRRPAAKPMMRQTSPEPTRFKRVSRRPTVKQNARVVGTVAVVNDDNGVVVVDLVAGSRVVGNDVLGVYRAGKFVRWLKIVAVDGRAAGGGFSDGPKPRVGDEVRSIVSP